MNDLSQHFFFDHRGTRRLRRKPQPSSSARVEHWANALHDAYFDRRRMDRRDKSIGDCDTNGEPIVWSHVNFQKLLAKITQMVEREKARGGQDTNVFETIQNAFMASSVDHRACLRIYILDAAYVGDLTPEGAETWARRFGLPQIRKRKCRNHCDPMGESQWSLLMAAVWIQWLDLRYVARLSPDSIQFLPVWVKIEHEDGSTGCGLDPDDDLEQAKPELMKFLRSGTSQATGFRDGERREISPAEWADLRIVGRYSAEGFSVVTSHDGQRDAFERVRLSRDTLLAAFRATDEPPVSDETSETDEPPAAGETSEAASEGALAPANQPAAAEARKLKRPRAERAKPKTTRLVAWLLSNPDKIELPYKELEPILTAARINHSKRTFYSAKSEAKKLLQS